MELKENMSVSEYRKLVNGGVIQQGKKRLKFVAPLEEFAEILKKDINASEGQNKPSENKKIKNATKVVANGIKFDSKLEKYMYDKLTSFGIKFQFHKKYELLPGFVYDNKKIQPITWTLDFELEEYAVIIDVKGYPNDAFPLKLKMFKKLIYDIGIPHVKIFLPSSKIKCDNVLAEILSMKKLLDD